MRNCRILFWLLCWSPHLHADTRIVNIINTLLWYCSINSWTFLIFLIFLRSWIVRYDSLITHIICLRKVNASLWNIFLHRLKIILLAILLNIYQICAEANARIFIYRFLKFYCFSLYVWLWVKSKRKSYHSNQFRFVIANSLEFKNALLIVTILFI